MRRTESSSSASVPKWEPSIPVDLAQIVDRMRYYSNAKFRFVVFANGTCALVRNDGQYPAKEAKDLLLHASSGHVDFDPRSMDDGNYLVAFGEHLCGVVLVEEMQKHRMEIDARHAEGLRKDEVLMNSGAIARKFDDRGKAGILARARLFLDAKDLMVAQVCEPQK